MEKQINIEEIQKIIPHRYPFLLIDRITEINGMDSIKGYKNISANEEIFLGHFPQNPIFPGVLIVEAMAQLGAFLILRRYPAEKRMAYFAGIDKVRFKKLVIPGDRLDLEVKVVRDRGPFAILEGMAFVDGEKAASATLLTSLA